MKGVALAVFGSLGVHAGFALVWAWTAVCREGPAEESVRLDLSKMELGVEESARDRPSPDAMAQPPDDISASAKRPEPTAPVPEAAVPEAALKAAAERPRPEMLSQPVAHVTVTAPEEEPAKLAPVDAAVAPVKRADEADVDEPVRLERTIRPRYPEEARRRGVTGTVVLHVRVGADGAVTEVTVARSSGNAILDEAAKKSVRGAKFVPARRGGCAVAAAVDLPVAFRLND